MASSLSNVSTARIMNKSYTDCSVELVTMAHRVFDFAKAIWLVKNLL